MVEIGDKYRIQATFDAFKIFECLAESAHHMTVSQLANATGQSRNRVFRVIKTLEELGYVSTDSYTNTVRPTLRMLTLGQQIANANGIEDLARPAMQELRDLTGETVYMSVREGYESVCILRFESSRMLRITAQPGQRWPMGIGSAGTALLLHAPQAVQDHVRNTVPGLQERWESILDLYESQKITFVDGRHGFSSDNGVVSIGTPVGRDGKYALCIAWPVNHSEQNREEFRVSLLSAAQKIRSQLGQLKDLDLQITTDSEVSHMEEVTTRK